MRTFLTLVLMLSVIPSFAAAQNGEISAEERERDARALFEMASRHYETGRLEEAIEEYERAYSLAPIPAFQYNLYLAHRDAGNTAEAATALRSYLDTAEDIPDDERASLERRHRLLAERVEAEPALEASPEQEDPTRPEVAPEVEETDTDSHIELDETDESSSGLSPLVGGVTLGVGGALLVGALIEGLVANAQKSDLDAVCNEDGCLETEQNDIVSRFETHRNVAWGLLAAGVAVSATGVILLLLRGDDASDEQAFNVSCDGNGCMSDLRVTF